MSEEANTRAGEEQESRASGLLLSVEPMQGGEPQTLIAQDSDKTDTDSDTLDTPDILTDVDGTDESDAGGDSDGTDTLGDSDSTDATGDSDGNDS